MPQPTTTKRATIARAAMEVNTQRTTLSVNDVCRELGIGRSTLYRMIDSGKIRSHRVESRRRFTQADIDAYLSTVRV